MGGKQMMADMQFMNFVRGCTKKTRAAYVFADGRYLEITIEPKRHKKTGSKISYYGRGAHTIAVDGDI